MAYSSRILPEGTNLLPPPAPASDGGGPPLDAHQGPSTSSSSSTDQAGKGPLRNAPHPGKMFVGGLSPETTRDRLKEYFSRFGDVVDCVVMTDPTTGRTRGFGFVTFRDGNSCHEVLRQRPHVIDAREVDPKMAVPREEMDSGSRTGHHSVGRETRRHQPRGAMHSQTRKVFVGGLPSSATDDALRTFFSSYGQVEEAVVIHDKQTRLPRGFGFITFLDELAADQVVNIHYHEFLGKMVEVKRAEPKPVEMSHSRSPTRHMQQDMYGADPWSHPAGPSHRHGEYSLPPFEEGRRRAYSARAWIGGAQPSNTLPPPPSFEEGRSRAMSLQPAHSPWAPLGSHGPAGSLHGLDAGMDRGGYGGSGLAPASGWDLSADFGSLSLLDSRLSASMPGLADDDGSLSLFGGGGGDYPGGSGGPGGRQGSSGGNGGNGSRGGHAGHGHGHGHSHPNGGAYFGEHHGGSGLGLHMSNGTAHDTFGLMGGNAGSGGAPPGSGGASSSLVGQAPATSDNSPSMSHLLDQHQGWPEAGQGGNHGVHHHDASATASSNSGKTSTASTGAQLGGWS